MDPKILFGDSESHEQNLRLERLDLGGDATRDRTKRREQLGPLLSGKRAGDGAHQDRFLPGTSLRHGNHLLTGFGRPLGQDRS